MKSYIMQSAALSMAFLSISGCSQAQDNTNASASSNNGPVASLVAADSSQILARKNGYELSDEHFEKAVLIEMVFNEQSDYSDDQRKILKASLIEEFEADPAQTLDSLAEVYADIQSDNLSDAPVPAVTRISELPAATNVANGHTQLRQNVNALSRRTGSGKKFPDQAFNTPAVNQLRSFMTNSQIVNGSYNDYSSGYSAYTFCADGTFRYYYGSTSSISSSFGDAELSGTHEVAASGYWDAYHEGGNIALLLYSTDAGFADQSINNTGLLPLPIAHYQEDAIQLGQRGQPPTPDMLLKRTRVSGCS